MVMVTVLLHMNVSSWGWATETAYLVQMNRDSFTKLLAQIVLLGSNYTTAHPVKAVPSHASTLFELTFLFVFLLYFSVYHVSNIKGTL